VKNGENVAESEEMCPPYWFIGEYGSFSSDISAQNGQKVMKRAVPLSPEAR